MAERDDSLKARIKSSLKFWLVVAVGCAAVGIGAFYVGRDYVGKHLHEMDVRQRAPEIVPQVTSTAETDVETATEPPVEPIVIVTEREPTAREERRVRRELAEPQDGAQLHAAEAAGTAESERSGSDTEAPREEATGDRESGPQPEAGGFVVTAGSFADEVNARRQVERLTEQGYQPYLSTVEKDGLTYHRVNVGLYDTRDQAERVRDQLRSQGFDAIVWAEQE